MVHVFHGGVIYEHLENHLKENLKKPNLKIAKVERENEAHKPKKMKLHIKFNF